MPELGTYGSVRGVPSNGHPYRDRCAARTGRLAVDNAHALPTAPAFAHKLHSLLPPPTTRTQSPSGPGSIGAATILTRGEAIHLSTAGHQLGRLPPRLKIRSARWLKIRSAPTPSRSGCQG